MAKKSKQNFNPNEKCTQAVLFARVSSKIQKNEGISLDVQAENITKYCDDKGLIILEEFNIDESSMNGERKQYHQMLTDNILCRQTNTVTVDIPECSVRDRKNCFASGIEEIS